MSLFSRTAVTPALPASAAVAARPIVDACMHAHGLDSASMWNDELNLWVVTAGSWKVFVRPVRTEPDDPKSGSPEDYLEVFTRVMALPSYPLLALYRNLLEVNMRLIGCAFGVESGVIFLRHERPLAGMSAGELDAMISLMVQNAESTVPYLSQEFPLGAAALL